LEVFVEGATVGAAPIVGRSIHVYVYAYANVH
jgi:hypothetical protein